MTLHGACEDGVLSRFIPNKGRPVGRRETFASRLCPLLEGAWKWCNTFVAAVPLSSLRDQGAPMIGRKGAA